MSHIFYWGRGIFTLHHGRSRVASFRFTCPHLQVDFHSESSPVDSPADIFIHSSFLFLFFPERGNRNAFYPRCPPRNSVRRWQKKTKKTEDLWNNLLLSAPPPLAAENYEQWAALTFLHSQVRRRLRSRPGPMAHREALSYLSPAGQWRAAPRLTWRLSVRSLSSQRSIPASAGITEDLTPAGSDVRCPRQNLTRRYLCQLYRHQMKLTVLSMRTTPLRRRGTDFFFSVSKRAERRRGETITPRSYWNES